MKILARSGHYKPELQGLRAIAVGLVIYYHSGLPGLPGGYIGVDIFFVISGYLITGLLLREMERDSRISLTNFYARRIRRLLPAASLVLLVTVAVAWFVYSPLALKKFASAATATATYLSNFWFIHLSTDYLAESTDANPLLHTWSLGVEEQFYLIWPLIFLAAFHACAVDRARRRLWILMICIGLISFAASYWMTFANQPVAFFSSPTRAWEFAVGGIIALWFSRGGLGFSRSGLGFSRGGLAGRHIAHASGYLGLCLIFVGAILFDRSTAFPGTAALLPVLGAALLIWASHSERLDGANRFLSIRPMQWIGDLSYSLYLWHWPVFIFLGVAADDTSVFFKIACIVLVFALSWATLLWIENPIRYRRALPFGSVRTIGVGAATVALCMAVTVASWLVAGQILERPDLKVFATVAHDVPRLYEEGCHSDQFSRVPTECIFGDPEGETLVVLFGDSHVAQWFPAVEKLALDRGWKIHSLTKSGCPSLDFMPYSPLLGRAYPECVEWRSAAISRIRTLRPDFLIMSNSINYRSFRTDHDLTGLWRDRLAGILEDVVGAAKQTIIIRDTPRLQYSAPECLIKARWFGDEPKQMCVFDYPEEDNELAFEGLRQAASAFPTAHIVDLNDTICGLRPCSVLEGETVKYRDRDHLSKTYSTHLAPVLGQALVAE